MIMTTYAGFNYPKFLADLPNKPLAKRLEDYKKDKPVSIRLNGYRMSGPCPNATGRMFYLDSDFMPNLRWQWCDEVEYSRIDHKGWFPDEFGDSDTIRGLVFRLPHGRGFLAAWSYNGMASLGEVEYYIYDNEIDAARSADSMAEKVAEKERIYTYEHTCHSCYDYHDDEPLTEVNNKQEPICSNCVDKDEDID